MNADFAKALIKAQQEMPAVAKMARAQYGQYMDLDHLLAGMLPVLNRNQIMLAQFPTQNDQGFPSLTTVLVHESGDSLSFEMPLVMDEAAKMNRTQAQGSAITYARRYAAAAALGISSEKDDDANAASAGGVNAPASSQPSSPKPPLAPTVGAAPPAEDTPEDQRRRMAERWDSYNVHKAIETVGTLDSVEVLNTVSELEMGREARGKGKPRKMVDHAIRDRIASLEGEPPAVDAPEKTGQAAVAQADGPPPADDGVRATAGQSFEPASPSENTHPDGVKGEVTAAMLKAALSFIQDQPSTVENAHAWTVSGVLLGLSQPPHKISASTLEEVPREGLDMVWGAIPDDVRAMVQMYGPETLEAEAAKAK